MFRLLSWFTENELTLKAQTYRILEKSELVSLSSRVVKAEHKTPDRRAILEKQLILKGK